MPRRRPGPGAARGRGRRGDGEAAAGNHHHRTARANLLVPRRGGAPPGERRTAEALVCRRQRGQGGAAPVPDRPPTVSRELLQRQTDATAPPGGTDPRQTAARPLPPVVSITPPHPPPHY